MKPRTTRDSEFIVRLAVRAVVGCVLSLLLASAGRAEDSVAIDDLEERCVDALIQQQRLEQGRELAESAYRHAAIDWPRVPGFSALSTELQGTVQKVVSENAAEAALELEAILPTVNTAELEARRELIALRAQRSKLETDLGKSEAGNGVAGWIAQLINPEMRWLWLAGSIGFAIVGLIAWHDRRHEYRRRLNGARGRALGISRLVNVGLVTVVLITVIVFAMGPRLHAMLLSRGSSGDPQQRVRNELATLQTKNAEMEKLAANRKKSVPAGTDPASLEVSKVRGLLEQLIVANSVREMLLSKAAEESQVVAELVEQRAAAERAIAQFERRQRIAYVVVGIVLASAIGLGGYWVLASRAKRLRKIAQTCPKCLGTNTLKVESVSGAVSPMLICENILDDQDCNFSFPANYAALNKLCFPTLGHPRSGKTHWLAMVYRELNRGNYDSQVRFERLKSQSSRDFDEVVERVLRARMGTGATASASIPHPLVFQFGDGDRWGRSNLLVNMFDYSGEVTQRSDHAHRRRALAADGYFFFLDPTFSADEQNEELINFRDDVRMVRGTKAGQTIDAPVALCVSKIDLLGAPGGGLSWAGDMTTKFYEDLARIDPTGEDLSLRVMRARSDLIQGLAGSIWPGWNIERQVREAFGGRYSFFPMTPVGLADRESADLTDLSRRTVDPYAIVHPLIWLLHMNGYSVTK